MTQTAVFVPIDVHRIDTRGTIARMPTIFYDLETFGLSAAHDRIAEFAGILTDDALELMEQPYELRCLPPPDYLADPMACLTTGITPQMALQTGLPEPDFARKIHTWFTTYPETLILGYNNTSFDDEFIRHLFYRTFLDPYEWHFANGNRRMDLLTVIPALFDFHREALMWPRTADGLPDFRLEALSEANDALSGTSHEALSDTFALRNLTKVIQERLPDVWKSLPSLFDKKTVHNRLEQARRGRHGLERLVVYSSPRLKEKNRSSSLFVVLGREDGPAGQWWLLDAARSAEALLQLNPEEVAERWYTKERPEELRLLQRVNPRRFPCILPATTRQVDRMDELGLDRDRLRHNVGVSEEGNLSQWAARLIAAFSREGDGHGGEERDVDARLYDGFFPRSDRGRLAELTESTTTEIVDALRTITFSDPRYTQLARRFVGRYTPGRLSMDEREKFRQESASRIDVTRFDEAWREAIQQREIGGGRKKILPALRDHRNGVVRRMNLEGRYGILEES